MGRTMWCPACSANLDVSRLAGGQRVRCGQCKTVVIVPEDLPEAAPVAPVAPAAPPAFAPRPPLRARRGRVHVPNLLPWAILATIFCCQIGGILAIIFAVQANSAAERGEAGAARRAEKNARMWLWISAVTLPAVIALLVFSGYFAHLRPN